MLDHWDGVTSATSGSSGSGWRRWTATLAAWLYVLNDYEGGLPSARYLGIVADAAEMAGAPADYVPGAAQPPDRGTARSLDSRAAGQLDSLAARPRKRSSRPATTGVQPVRRLMLGGRAVPAQLAAADTEPEHPVRQVAQRLRHRRHRGAAR